MKHLLLIALGCSAIVVVAVAAVSALFWYEHNTPFSSINLRRQDLSHISVACYLFADDHAGQFPPDWSGVLSYSNQAMFSMWRKTSVKECIFLCPSRWPDYRYISGLSTASPPDSVLAYPATARQSANGGLVLLAGRSTRSMSKAELEAALDRTYRWLTKPNHAVEPTRALSGARGSP